jgi:hypothetical protein
MALAPVKEKKTPEKAPKGANKELKEPKNLLFYSFALIAIIGFLVYAGALFLIITQSIEITKMLNSIILDSTFFNNFTSILQNKNYGGTIFTLTITIVISYLLYIAYLANRNLTIISSDQSELRQAIGGYFLRIFNFILPLLLTSYVVSIAITSSFWAILGIFAFIVILFEVGFKLEGLWFFLSCIIIIIATIGGYVYYDHSSRVLEVFAFISIFAISSKTEKNFVRRIAELSSNYENAQIFVKENISKELGRWSVSMGMLYIAGNINIFLDSIAVIAALLIIIGWALNFTALFIIYILLALPFWITMLSLIKILPRANVIVDTIDEKEEGILLEENYKNGYIFLLKKDGNLQKKIMISSIKSIQNKIEHASDSKQPRIGHSKDYL